MEQVDVGQAGEPNTPSGDKSSEQRRRSGVLRIAAERVKQRGTWPDEHDDRNVAGELVEAAQDLLTAVRCGLAKAPSAAAEWGLAERHQDPIRRLEIAGALIAAEIDRRLRVLDREASSPAVAPSLPPEVHAPAGEPRDAADGPNLASCIERFPPGTRRGYDVVHSLKVRPEYFEAILAGEKRCEVRKDDRAQGFEADDVLRLQEYVPLGLATEDLPQGYTGRDLFAIVTHVLRNTDDLLQRGFVALSIELIRGARVYSDAAWEAIHG